MKMYNNDHHRKELMDILWQEELFLSERLPLEAGCYGHETRSQSNKESLEDDSLEELIICLKTVRQAVKSQETDINPNAIWTGAAIYDDQNTLKRIEITVQTSPMNRYFVTLLYGNS